MVFFHSLNMLVFVRQTHRGWGTFLVGGAFLVFALQDSWL